MLLPDNIHPANSIYYNASLVLRNLQQKPCQNLFDLYQEIKSGSGMTFPVFMLCLDWIYLLGMAELKDNGDITLCS